MQTWMNQQVGFRGFWDKLKAEAPQWAQKLPTIPRLLTSYLEMEVHSKNQNQLDEIKNLIESNNKHKCNITFANIFILGLLVGGAGVYFYLKH